MEFLAPIVSHYIKYCIHWQSRKKPTTALLCLLSPSVLHKWTVFYLSKDTI